VGFWVSIYREEQYHKSDENKNIAEGWFKNPFNYAKTSPNSNV